MYSDCLLSLQAAFSVSDRTQHFQQVQLIDGVAETITFMVFSVAILLYN
ncbi:MULTISPECIES: hypothetical protein [unclassified Microcoleus]